MPFTNCKNILVPVDFSKDSLRAAQGAIQLAVTLGANVTLLHIVHDPTDAPGFYGQKKTGSKFLRKVSEIAEELLADFVTTNKLDAVANANKVKLATLCKKGIPVGQILKFMEKNPVELLVVGASGKSKWDQLFVGSVATQLVNLSTVPVLLIRSKK